MDISAKKEQNFPQCNICAGLVHDMVQGGIFAPDGCRVDRWAW
jgi:hypothetical protein